MTDTKGNSGSYNSGDWNSGGYNSGDWNSGSYNSGSYNSGSCNSGYRNSGNYNSGSYNSGYYNSGNWNSGTLNSGYRNSGSFNTTTPDMVNFFNKPFSLKEWNKITKPIWLSEPKPTFWDGSKRIETNMEDEWKKALAHASKEDVQRVIDLPNFDSEVFKGITGLELGNGKSDCDGKKVTIEGEDYILTKV